MAERTRPRRPAIAIAAPAALLVVALDQLTKVWAIATLHDGASLSLLGPILQLELAYNTGGAFSTATGLTWLLTLISAAVTIGLVIWAARTRSLRLGFAIGILLGGAVGNLIDRAFRGTALGSGAVVDFLNYFDLFIGNLADVAVFVGVMLVAALSARHAKPATNTRPEPEEPQGLQRKPRGAA